MRKKVQVRDEMEAQFGGDGDGVGYGWKEGTVRLILKGVRDDDRFGIVMPTSAVSLHLRAAGPRISGMGEVGRDRARFGTLEVMVLSGLWTRGCRCVVCYLPSGCRVALLVISLCYWSSIFHVSVTSTYPPLFGQLECQQTPWSENRI